MTWEIIAGVEGNQPGLYLFDWDSQKWKVKKEVTLDPGEEKIRTPHDVKIVSHAGKESVVANTKLGFACYDKKDVPQKRIFPLLGIDKQLSPETAGFIGENGVIGTLEQITDKVYYGIYYQDEDKTVGIGLVEFSQFGDDLTKYQIHGKQEEEKQWRVTAPLTRFQEQLITCNYKDVWNFTEERRIATLTADCRASAALDHWMAFITADGRYHAWRDGQLYSSPPRLSADPRSLDVSASSIAIASILDEGRTNYYLLLGLADGRMKVVRVQKDAKQPFLLGHTYNFLADYLKTKEEGASPSSEAEQKEGKRLTTSMTSEIRGIKITDNGYVLFGLRNRILRVELDALLNNDICNVEQYIAPDLISSIEVYQP